MFQNSLELVSILHPRAHTVYHIKPLAIGSSYVYTSSVVCLSDRCRRVVEIARKYNLLVVCDDVYNLLSFSQDKESAVRRKRLFAYDDP